MLIRIKALDAVFRAEAILPGPAGRAGNHAMERENRQAHWEDVYAWNTANKVSWFQDSPVPSLE